MHRRQHLCMYIDVVIARGLHGSFMTTVTIAVSTD